jgi:hypothetical protein
LRGELVAHLQAAVLGEAGRERDQRAAQAELVERLRAQAARDVPQLLGAFARELLDVGDRRVELGRRRPPQAVELQDDPGQRLSELVVQLAREPAPLALLRGQRARRALPALKLEPVEHLVERVEQVADLAGRAVDVDPPPGRHGIDAAHQPREPLQGPERAAHEHDVDRHDDDEADGEHHDLGARRRRADGRGREHEHQRGAEQHRPVDRHHAPEQRHPSRVARTAPSTMGVAPHVKSDVPAPGVVLYSAFADPAMTVPAIVAGVDAIVHKAGQTRDLFDAIRRAARGDTTLPEIDEALLHAAGHALDLDDLPLLGMLIHRTPSAEIAATLRIEHPELDRRIDGMLGRLRTPTLAERP